MKTIIYFTIMTLAFGHLFARDISKIPISADSTCPYDFRGEPEWDYPPYKKLFEAKTYGELASALENFGTQWKTDSASHKGEIAHNAYYVCKQATVRLYYLSGEVAAADRLLEELHPKHHLKGEDAEKLLAANVEKDRIRRAAEEIRVMYMELGEKDPYQGKVPENLHELYLPLIQIIRELLGG